MFHETTRTFLIFAYLGAGNSFDWANSRESVAGRKISRWGVNAAPLVCQPPRGRAEQTLRAPEPDKRSARRRSRVIQLQVDSYHGE
jgi:hypothetical protein